MSACISLHGIIREGYALENYPSIKLEQPDGYKIDLIFRLNEWADSFGRSVTVRYWITDKPTTKEDAQEGFIKSLFGPITAEMEAREYSYSEYTSGINYDSDLKIGGHDLLRELLGQAGKHIWIEIEKPSSK